MARKSFKKVSSQLSDLLQEVKNVSNEALNRATQNITNKLKSNTPVNTGLTKESWESIIKYNNVKFDYNVASSKTGIPLLNLIEFSSKGHPFAIKTFESCFSEIENELTSELNKVK